MEKRGLDAEFEEKTPADRFSFSFSRSSTPSPTDEAEPTKQHSRALRSSEQRGDGVALSNYEHQLDAEQFRAMLAFSLILKDAAGVYSTKLRWDDESARNLEVLNFFTCPRVVLSKRTVPSNPCI